MTHDYIFNDTSLDAIIASLQEKKIKNNHSFTQSQFTKLRIYLLTFSNSQG
jgi:hypothetical protein